MIWVLLYLAGVAAMWLATPKARAGVSRTGDARSRVYYAAMLTAWPLVVLGFAVEIVRRRA